MSHKRYQKQKLTTSWWDILKHRTTSFKIDPRGNFNTFPTGVLGGKQDKYNNNQNSYF